MRTAQSGFEQRWRVFSAPNMRGGFGDVRGVCPILVLVNCLQKEHLA